MLAGVVDILARLYFEGQDLVQPSLGFVHVSAGTCTTSKCFAGSIELRSGGGALGQHQCQLVISEHGFKVGAANPRREILLVLQQGGFCIVNLSPGLT